MTLSNTGDQIMINIDKETDWKRSATNNSVTRVLCIDPALSKCGWSVLDLKQKKKSPSISVVRYGNISSTGEANKVAYRDYVETFGKRTISLLVLRTAISDLVREFEPDYIVIEDAFFHKKFPTAYAALEQCICTITILCKDEFNMPLFRIPTRSAKKSITSTGASKKEDVITAILSHPHITFRQKKLASVIDHHSADSIAVGYHFLIHVCPHLENTTGDL